MKCKDFRKIAEMWERNNADLLKQSRSSRREYYRGFMAACQAFQDLIDGVPENVDTVLSQLETEKMEMSKREIATVLAALRQFQNTRNLDEGVEHLDFFENTTPLTDNEIDDLCERINLD